tara:strand:+ start:179 stop:901 length:723 start_codon:yes stop_codon:yes gene_type:complete
MKNKIYLYLILLFLINCSQSNDVEKVEPFVSGSSTTTIYSEIEQVTFSSCSKWLDSLEKDEDEFVSTFNNSQYENTVGFIAGRSLKELDNGEFIYDYSEYIYENINRSSLPMVINLYNPNDGLEYEIKTFEWNDSLHQRSLNWANSYTEKLANFLLFIEKYNNDASDIKIYFRKYKEIKSKELFLIQHAVFAATPIYISNLDSLIAHPIIEDQPRSVRRILNIAEELETLRADLSNLDCS